jgi:hypothetical protein
VISSQDANHPLYLAAHMTGGSFLESKRTMDELYSGDPEFVNVIPVEQYLNEYTFFTDPSYSETSLVVVRKPRNDGRFADVKLACASGPLQNWIAVGSLEFARVDLTTGNYQPVIPGCEDGVQRIASDGPFGVTVWGWGTRSVGPGVVHGSFVSYAYPAGAALVAQTKDPGPVIP